MTSIDAKFEKVSLEQFLKDWKESSWIPPYYMRTTEDLKRIYESIKVPTRSTRGSAGYDFCIPDDCTFSENDEVIFPTGIRCKMPDGYFLMIVPRSGLGFKYGVRLVNTCGVIDSDYYYSNNEGHIMMKLARDNTSHELLHLHAGDRIAQGIFVPFGVVTDDNVNVKRQGGFGSTGT